MIDTIAWLICLLTALPLLVLALECIVGARPPKLPAGSPAPPPFVVVMPAHQEAAGIAAALRSVITQLRPCDAVLVVADNCTDDTAAIARKLGARVVERIDPSRMSKGYALEFAKEELQSDPTLAKIETILVIDADCWAGPGALQRLAAKSAESGAAVQGAYLLECPENAPVVVRVSCFAFLIKNLVRQLALHRLAGTALLQGSGMAFPRDVFLEAEWPTQSLVEDLEFGLDLLLSGTPVIFEPLAKFYSSASSLGGTTGQRRRWEHGMLQTAAVCVPRLLGGAFRTPGGRARKLAERWPLLAVALDMLVPPTVLLGLLLVAAMLSVWAMTGASTPFFVLLSAGLILTFAVVNAWWMQGRAILRPADLIGSGRYLLWKLPILFQFVTRRERKWIRTERGP